MTNQIAKGVWPTMITPFKSDQSIDYDGLQALVEWYLERKVDGFFAVCQSSEMFFLKREERNALAKAVVEFTDKRVPVIASGHVSESLEEQVADIVEMSETGVDTVVLVSNRLIKEGEDERTWLENLDTLLEKIPESVNLGMYECPYPFKHYLSDAMVSYLHQSGRFLFIKDTSSDIEVLRRRADLVAGGSMQLYNANSATLLESLRFGYDGFSGVMANFHPQLYHWLWENHQEQSPLVQEVQDFLGLTSMVEMYGYPRIAKYFLQSEEGLPIEETTRVNHTLVLGSAVKELAHQLKRQSQYWENRIT